MLSRLIVRLSFKAVLSLAMLLGIASYGLYLSGGDPKSLWQRIASGTIDSVGESIGALGDRVPTSVAMPAAMSGSGGAAAGQVWTWRDENGLAHYASAPPAGVTATPLGIDPNVNVLAPVSARAGREALGEPLPGIGGASARARGEAAPPDAARAEALLRMLQTPSR